MLMKQLLLYYNTLYNTTILEYSTTIADFFCLFLHYSSPQNVREFVRSILKLCYTESYKM